MFDYIEELCSAELGESKKKIVLNHLNCVDN